MLILCGQLRMSQVPKDAKAMIQSNGYNTAFCKAFTIVAVQVSIALRISAAVQVYTNGKLLIALLGGSPNIQV